MSNRCWFLPPDIQSSAVAPRHVGTPRCLSIRWWVPPGRPPTVLHVWRPAFLRLAYGTRADADAQGTARRLYLARYPARMFCMKTLPLSEVKDRLSGLVDEAESTHEMVTITKHGRPAAVLIAAEDLESLHETLFWLSQPGIREDLGEASEDVKSGETIDSAALRSELGLPTQ
jgi:antitoxin YefM